MIKKVTPAQAAAVMGCSPQFIRLAMQQDMLNIGTAIKMSSIWTYNIVPEKMAQYIGISKEELEKRIKETEQ